MNFNEIHIILLRMRKPFREHHLLQILKTFEEQTLPLDAYLRNYFRAHPSVGSKDRKEICEAIYSMIRWRSMLDYFSEKPHSWEKRYAQYRQFPLTQAIQDASIPAHIRASFPKAFYQLLSDSLSEDKALEFCLLCNEPAPTTIRVNLLKISRSELMDKWKDSFQFSPCLHSQAGIQFQEKINFFGMEEFKAGLFEVQDEASQLIADLVAIKPGEQLLDYCAGSGGKSLAIAPKMKGRGQIFLHDIRAHTLAEAKKRLKRAGIQNAQILPHTSPHRTQLKEKIDWVLVDAPCTGTGTLRRNPDMKWKFDLSTLERLVKEQRAIFAEALAYVKPGGHIVFATCSVLPHENESQMNYFLSHFPLEKVGEPFSSFPSRGGMDGFFGIVLKKKKD